MTILLNLNSSWNAFNFRLGLIKSLYKLGHRVVVLAPPDSYSDQLKIYGVKYHSIFMNQKGTNPFQDFKLFFSYIKNFKNIKPDLILSFTIKPNIYGNIVAAYLRIPVINNITGLGTLFINKSLSTIIAKYLYRIALRSSAHVFFQNTDDQFLFSNSKLINPIKTSVIHGSGVNTAVFKSNKKVNHGRRFLFVGRLLVDKGIYEYLDAIKIVIKKNPEIEFLIAGELESNNKTALTMTDLDRCIKGIPQIKYLGQIGNMLKLYKKVDVMVLPSYREGLSKSLIEAASMSLPLVTADVPGCNDVVIEGYNGILCQPKNSKSLAKAMLKMSLLNADIRHQMGLNGRKRVEDRFDEQLIISNYLNIIEAIGLENLSSLKT